MIYVIKKNDKFFYSYHEISNWDFFFAFLGKFPIICIFFEFMNYLWKFDFKNSAFIGTIPYGIYSCLF